MPENRHHPVRRPKRGKRVKKRKVGLTPLLVAGLIVVGAVAMGEPEPAKGAQKEPAEAIQASGVDVQSVITLSEIVREGEDPLEDEKIEAALVEQGYFLEEVPLGFTEQDFLHTACQEAGIPYALALAVIEQETDFRNVMGDDGASCGYMQVQEKWHRERTERLGVTDLMDPFGNFRVGCDFLAELMGEQIYLCYLCAAIGDRVLPLQTLVAAPYGRGGIGAVMPILCLLLLRLCRLRRDSCCSVIHSAGQLSRLYL